MITRIKKILTVDNNCDYKRLSIEDLLLIKEYINNLEDGNKSLLEHNDYMQEKNNKLVDIINGIDVLLKDYIDECREELDIIKKSNDYIKNFDYINECSIQFDAIRRNVGIIMTRIQELKENKQ